MREKRDRVRPPREKCVGSNSRATRVGDEINGVGVLSTRDTSGFRVEIVGQTTPPPNKLRDALSPQHKG
ncbi:hypothetical protein T01_1541, partial [Trichinella spiralis]